MTARHTYPVRPNLYLLTMVAFWGFNFVAVKEAYLSMPPPVVALLRYVVMGLGLALVCAWRRESLRYPKEDRWRLLYLGFVSLGIYMVLFLVGMHGSGAMEGSIIFQFSPVFTAFLAPLFGQERFSPGTVGGALIALGGIGLIAYNPAQGHQNLIASNVVLLVAALLWAYSVVLMKPLLAKFSPLRVLTLSLPGALPVMLIFGLVPTLGQDWSAVSLYGWAMFVHIAVLSGIVAFLCFYEGVREVGPTGATLYQFLVPIAAMLFAIGIEHVRPNWIQLLGFFVVLAGVALASRWRLLALAAS